MTRHTLSTLQSELRQRLAHNERYIAQSVECRANLSSLTCGTAKSAEWVRGEESAIQAENEWIRALLAAPPPPAAPIQWEEMTL